MNDKRNKFKVNQLGFKCKECGEITPLKKCIEVMMKQTLIGYPNEMIKMNTLAHLTHSHQYHNCEAKEGFMEDVHLHINMPEYRQDEYELVIIDE